MLLYFNLDIKNSVRDAETSQFVWDWNQARIIAIRRKVMEEIEKFAEETLRINQLKSMPNHTKRKVYNIYKQDIYNLLEEAIEERLNQINDCFTI